MPPPTHTFVFADLAGFTALTEAHGDEEAADAAAAFVGGVRAMLEGHAAREVKTMGDAVMLHVEQAAAAISLAQQAVGNLGLRHGALGVRIGMHTGSAVRRGEDWFGATVNIAARICALAAVDQVLLSDATLTEAASAGRVPAVQDFGWRRLRHVSRPVHLHALSSPTASGRRPTRDPVCLMGVTGVGHTVMHAGNTYRFCSVRCATIFSRDPEVYLGRV